MKKNIEFVNLPEGIAIDSDPLAKFTAEIDRLFTEIRFLLNGTFQANIPVHIPGIVTTDSPVHIDVAQSLQPEIGGWLSFQTNNQQNHRIFGIGTTANGNECFGDLSPEQGMIILRAIIGEIVKTRPHSGYTLTYEEWPADDNTQPAHL